MFEFTADVFEFTAEKVYISDQEKVEFLKMEQDVKIEFSLKKFKSNLLLKSVSKDMMDDKSCY